MQSLKIFALKVEQPLGEFYVAAMPARDLVEISYSDVRRLVRDQRDLEAYLGIQRPIGPRRIKQIRSYISDSPDATFPTAVLLAVDERCAEFESEDGQVGVLTLHEYIPETGSDDEAISIQRIAKVIDGQHRIAAFMDDEGNWSYSDRPFDINVSIFVGADVSEQANVFATVNLAQTKVNTSLVYDLTELAKTPSPFKTCHNVAVALDGEKSSPLFHRIKRLGTATPGRRKEPLTQAAFVESLVKFISRDPRKDRNDLLEGRRLGKATPEELAVMPFRNLFIGKRETDISEILYNYFSSIEKRWPDSWRAIDRVGNLLPRSNAFKAFMVYLRQDVYPGLVGEDFGRVPEISEFAKWFKHVDAKDQDFTRKNFAPGSGGQSMFLKLLRGQISINDMVE